MKPTGMISLVSSCCCYHVPQQITKLTQTRNKGKTCLASQRVLMKYCRQSDSIDTEGSPLLGKLGIPFVLLPRQTWSQMEAPHLHSTSAANCFSHFAEHMEIPLYDISSFHLKTPSVLHKPVYLPCGALESKNFLMHGF